MGALIIGFAAMLLLDFLPLWRRRSWPDLIAFGFFFLLSLTIFFLIRAEVALPSTLMFIDSLMQRLGLHY